MAAKFSDARFWRKTKSLMGKVPMVREALATYYCMWDENTPAAAKALIAGVLVYFISPMDAIPDFIAPTGYVDDASVLTGAIAVLGANLKPVHWRKAAAALK
jgi:uncharacterized membrane protein YkvA (DUF1232 family)